MSRFGNLELGGAHEDHSHETSPQHLKGETHFLTEAQAAFENGNFESALRLFAKVLEFNPQNPAAWTGQVRMLIELGEFKEARLWADKALEKFSSEPELLAAKAVALARSGDLQGALAFSDSSIEERGDTPYVWLARGDVLLARNESRADYCFEKALAFAPGNWFLAWLAGRIRFYYRQFALALKLMQQALESNASHFLLWLELGRCQQALGLAGPARHSYEQARQLQPHHPEVTRAIRDLAQVGGFARFTGWVRNLFHS
jgi:Flp pilus assembly protein TadD, contains TPR repeats